MDLIEDTIQQFHTYCSLNRYYLLHISIFVKFTTATVIYFFSQGPCNVYTSEEKKNHSKMQKYVNLFFCSLHLL